MDTGLFAPIIFAPYADEIYDEGDYQVVRCWDQGKSDTLFDLESAIERENPGDLVIQFNYGLFEFEALSNLIFRQRWYGRRVFATLHSTVDQMEEPTFRLSHLRSALQQVTKLFVHSYRDAERLAELGVNDNVVVVAHGVSSFSEVADVQARQVKKIATYGFFLPGKGLMEIVEAVALAKRRGVNLELLMVNAEYPIEDSPEEIRAVKYRISDLGLSEQITVLTDFLSDRESLDLLRNSRRRRFPISAHWRVREWGSEGRSGVGAARRGDSGFHLR